MKALMLCGAVLLALASASAVAQGQDQTVATVSAPTGDVKASGNGGEFIAAAPGRRVKEGDRIMLGEDSSVTLVYANDCERTYDAPGVYPVGARCVAAVPATEPDGKRALLVAGGVAAGAALLYSMGDEPSRYVPPPPPPPPPVSP